MPETEVAKTLDCSPILQDAQICIKRDFSQRDYDLDIGEQLQFTFEEWTAVAQFAGRGLIPWRRAMGRRGDPDIAELQTIIAHAGSPVGWQIPPYLKRSVQELAGTISGKHTSTTISTMGGGRQTKNQQPRPGIAEGWNRFTPVAPVQVCPPFCCRNLAAMLDQSGAAFTPHDLLIQGDKVFGWPVH